MKKYLAFARVIILSELKNFKDILGTIFSFAIHITMFNYLWDFVLDGKTMAGYTMEQLVWYVIIGEAIIYSYNYYYKKIAGKVDMGDFAYDMTKPYNFLIRTIFEGIAELPITLCLIVTGGILGVLYVGALDVSLIQMACFFIVAVIAVTLFLMLHIIVGLLSIWIGRDVSSVWLLVHKAMLIFAFSPLELFPTTIQKALLFLPTTHVIYTPASLFVNFSYTKFIQSMLWEVTAIILLGLVLFVIYKKGVKKQNVQGI